MALCQPTVHGPVSTLSTTIRVTEQLPGATLRVIARGGQDREIARVVAAASDERVALSAGTTLTAGELLFALQEWNGERSADPSGDRAPRVQPAPASLPAVSFDSHVYHCGRCVRIGGTVPGATVEVSCAGVMLGQAIAEEFNARVTLEPAIPGELAVSARQVAAGLAAGPATVEIADRPPTAQGSSIPPPRVAPARGCDPSVLVSGVLPGAVVSFEREGRGSPVTAAFDADEYHLIVQPHLEPEERFRIKQDVAHVCERPGEWSEWITVGAIEPLDAPSVEGLLCAGAGVISLGGLRRGAIVHIAVGQLTPVSTDIDPTGVVFEATQTFTGQAPPGATQWSFQITPLAVGWLNVTQEVCGVVSAPSVLVQVEPPDAVEAVRIHEPLYECARAVSISHIHPGASVQIFARRQGREVALSEIVPVAGLEACIQVTPHLELGDRIYVRQWACSDISEIYGNANVEAAPALTAPTIVGSILEGDDFLEVKGLAGATIEAWINRPSFGRLFAGRPIVADALGAAQLVHTAVRFATGDQVSVRQRLCPRSEFSAESHPEVVQKFTAKPFYLLAHNPNTQGGVTLALGKHANALEPDINTILSDKERLCVSHFRSPGRGNLVSYLKAVHNKLLAIPGIALIYFDCKPTVAVRARHGVTLLQAIREHLTFDLPLNVVISVANLEDEDVKMFKKIRWGLRPREILMVDEENDVRKVARYFGFAGVSHCGYGNGISVGTRVLGPNVRPSIEAACAARAADGQFKFVNAWTINKNGDMRLFIRAGVDGMITDDLDSLDDIVGEPLMQALVRKATIKDNPFIRPPHAYGLAVYTDDRARAGTDANVTFTLTGAAGTASLTVDTRKINRMESGEWNYLTLASDDLGPLQEITVRRDNQGDAPDWRLGRIQVRSARYGVAMEAIFNRWIDSTAPFSQPLVDL